MIKTIKSYSIFVLFLLMSISVFSKNTKTPPGQAKKNIGIKGNVDVTNYPEIKLILSGNNGKKTILNNKIRETSGWNISEIANPIGNNKTEVIYKTPIKSKVKPGDRVEVELYIYNGNVGNGNWIQTHYTVPDLPNSKSIEIKTYEEIYGWGTGERTTIDDSGREYIFTKGGAGSYVANPAIYVVVPEDKKIKKLKIETLDSSGKVIETKPKIKIIKPKETGNIEIESNYFNFIENGAYRVKITPISKGKDKGKDKDDVEGEPKILNFIVDTKINSSYLEKEDIISELEVKDGKPIIKIKLSKLEELSGINKYSYTLSSGLQTEDKEKSVNGGKYLTPTEESALDDVEIPLGGFSEGSRLTLSFTVYDRLGHKKTFEKTYFIPKQSDGITAKVSGEAKQRESRIKIITEGNKDKFGIGSSIDGSSEEDETTISGS